MKIYLSILITIVLLACSTSSKKNLTEPEVQLVMNNWLELWASYDLDKIEDVFWNSPALTYFSSEKRGLIKGFDQLKPHHEAFGFVAGGKPASNSLWLREMNITIHRQTAVVDAIWYFGDKLLPEDSVQQGPCTFVIIRDTNKQAQIAHVHFGNY